MEHAGAGHHVEEVLPPQPRTGGTLAGRDPRWWWQEGSWQVSPRIPAHVQRHRDDEVCPSPERSIGLSPRWREVRDDPYVADVVAISTPFGIRPVQCRSEESGTLRDFADVLYVVVVERGRVFLQAPGGVYDAEIDVIGCPRPSVRASMVGPGLELGVALRHTRALRCAPFPTRG